MENIIIESSRFDAVNPSSNASWTTNIPKGIIINEGDIITIRNCFINSNTSDAENIEIAEDTTLRFVVGYYDINYGTLTNIGVDNIDYDYYIAYNNNLGSVADLTSVSFRCERNDDPNSEILEATIRFNDSSGKKYALNWGPQQGGTIQMPNVPVPRPPTGDHINVTAPVGYNSIVVSSLTYQLGKWVDSFLGASWNSMGQFGLSLNTGSIEINIPSGEYTRTGIAKFITDRLQLSPPSYADPISETGNDMMRRTDQGDNHLGIDDAVVVLPNDQRTVILSELFLDEEAVFATGLNYGKTVIIEYTLFDEDGNATERTELTATVDSEVNGGIAIGPLGEVTIAFTTNIWAEGTIYGLAILIVDNSSTLVFKRVGFDPNDTDTKKYTYNAPAYYGSSENVLFYDEDRSVFTWQYLHMPYYAENPPTIAIRQEKNTTAGNAEAYNKYYTITQLGGVFFLDLQPITFWESLGFTENQLIVPISDDGSIIRSSLVNRITRGYSSLASLLTLTNPKNVNLTIAQDIETTDTIEIFGTSLDNVSTGGFYLVEVNFGSQKYLFQKGNKNNIQAIVSKYNQIRDYITGYSDSSIGYQHVGEPFDLQNVSINILDPQTKLPDKNIGDKSTVFIQITRNPQPNN